MKNIQTEKIQYPRSLIEAGLDPLIIIDARGKITDMNKALTKITGIVREKITDTDFFNYFTLPKKALAVYKEVFKNGSITNSPLTFRHKNGKLTDVLLSGFVYKDLKGKVIGAVLVAKEIALQKWAIELKNANKKLVIQNKEKEKRAAELVIANKELAYQNDEKEKRAAELVIADKELVYQNGEKGKRADELRLAIYARTLIEASHDPLFTISPKGKITDSNNATIKITGVPREKLIGTDFYIYFTEPKKARKVYQEIFLKGFVTDYPLVIKDHKLTDVLFNGSVYKDEQGNVVGAVVVARDITEQKISENNLIEAIVVAELATTNAEKAKKKAEKATSIAETAVKAKQQFLSNMSHEIRTPMNAIIGFTKVLLKTDMSVKQHEYLDAIKLSGDSLIVLINDILDLARVDAGKMTFEHIPFKMATTISAILHLFEIRVREKNLEFITEYDDRIPSVLLGDPVRLHQIVQNIVSNAIKFTKDGTIKFRTVLLKETKKTVKIEFSVTDTGIGIAKDRIDKIFENFQQGSSKTSRLYGGTGLGLAIAKNLVEFQGGKISVKSKIDEGSTFSFELEFLKTKINIESEQIIPLPDKGINNIKVLVVEDIALNQLLMKTLLDDFGFERDVASNGKIAIQQLKEKKYDIILMDLHMPEMNGFETTEYIRNKLNSNIPIIALTADVTTVDLEKCKNVGMNDYISKPVDEKLLYSKIILLVKKPIFKIDVETEKSSEVINESLKCIDLHNLNRITKSDPNLMIEMISLYLEQTPVLISAMKKGLKEKDWEALYSATHKLIPSFSIMGISVDSENIARKVQEYAGSQKDRKGIPTMVKKLEKICIMACDELEVEKCSINNKK
jgi:PAS domain S-box-containing protein